MIQEIADALVQSWRNFASAFVLFVPRLVAATIIFAGGFVVSLAARRAIHRLLVWLRFDRLSRRSGASEMLRTADMPTAELLIAKIVFWIVWIGFIVSAVDTLQFAPFQGLVQEFFRFVPRFLVALLVFTLGFLIGNFLWRATLLAAVNAGLPGARLLSGALRILVIAIGVVMALEQLGLATAVVLTAFAIMFGALMLGGGDRVRARRTRRGQAADRTAAQGEQGPRLGRGAPSVVDATAAHRHMSFRRSSGVLLHPTSLPGRFGIGDLGPSAFAFVDLLASAGQRLWQVLPLGPTGYGDSPYQSFSAFAGNPLLISLDVLIEDGLLDRSEAAAASHASGSVDYERVIAHRRAIWPRVLERFDARQPAIAIASIGSAPQRRAGWTISRCSWRSRTRTGRSRGPSGSRTSPRAIRRPWRGGRRGWRARFGSTSSRSSVFRSMGAPARALPSAIDRDSRRSADFRRARQRRRVVAARSVSPRRRRPADGRRRRAARLLQRDRSAVGQPALRLGAPRRNRLCVVDRSDPRAADAGRSHPARSLPRLRRVVGSAGRRHDGHAR